MPFEKTVCMLRRYAPQARDAYLDALSEAAKELIADKTFRENIFWHGSDGSDLLVRQALRGDFRNMGHTDAETMWDISIDENTLLRPQPEQQSTPAQDEGEPSTSSRVQRIMEEIAPTDAGDQDQQEHQQDTPPLPLQPVPFRVLTQEQFERRERPAHRLNQRGVTLRFDYSNCAIILYGFAIDPFAPLRFRQVTITGGGLRGFRVEPDVLYTHLSPTELRVEGFLTRPLILGREGAPVSIDLEVTGAGSAPFELLALIIELKGRTFSV